MMNWMIPKIPKKYRLRWFGVEIGDCAECPKEGVPVEWHHLIFGKNRRRASDFYGMVSQLCHSCHNNLHKHDPELELKYRKKGQRMFEALYGHRTYMLVFETNYLEESEWCVEK